MPGAVFRNSSIRACETLARWISETTYEQIPPAAIEQAKKSILDYIGTATYGTPFTSAIQRGNIFGVQFHPEKSHRFGMDLLRRFADLQC